MNPEQSQSRPSVVSNCFLIASVFSFTSSLILPALRNSSGEYTIGIFILLFGWFDPIPWSANIFLLLASLYFQRNRKTTVFLCCIGFFVALTSFFPRDYPDLWFSDMPNPNKPTPAYLAIGFYFWISSFIMLGIAKAFKRERIDINS